MTLVLGMQQAVSHSRPFIPFCLELCALRAASTNSTRFLFTFWPRLFKKLAIMRHP